jgi:hypothetical protein
MKDYYFFTNFTPTAILDDIYAEMINGDYYLSPANVFRCDVSHGLKEKIKKIINLPISDCGFLKTKPRQNYPMHRDIFRISAINMPMFSPNLHFFSHVFDGKKYCPIEYKKNYFTILNVSQLHGVRNLSTSEERNVFSIGFKDTPFPTLLESFEKNELFNNYAL